MAHGAELRVPRRQAGQDDGAVRALIPRRERRGGEGTRVRAIERARAAQQLGVRTRMVSTPAETRAVAVVVDILQTSPATAFDAREIRDARQDARREERRRRRAAHSAQSRAGVRGGVDVAINVRPATGATCAGAS